MIELVANSAALSYTWATAEVYAEKAKEALDILQDSSAKRCLISFADFIVNSKLAEGSRRSVAVGTL